MSLVGDSRLWVALAVVAACGGSKHHEAPSAAQCQAYRDKLTALGNLPSAQQTPTELSLCQQHMHADEIACFVAAKTLDEALACKPAVDDRPAEAKRTSDECSALAEHAQEIAAAPPAEGLGPPFTPYMATLLARECSRWFTKPRYDCVMKSTTSFELLACPP